MFGKKIVASEWKDIFTLSKKTTLDSQTRIFQFKTLHRILPTNSLLYKYQIRNDPWCDHCQNVIETLEHTFHLCPSILELWYNIAEWVSPEIDLFQYINSENIILGVYKENKFLENTLILAIKRYIYINKCKQNPISDAGAKMYINYIMGLETRVRSERVRTHHQNKWAPIVRKLAILNVWKNVIQKYLYSITQCYCIIYSLLNIDTMYP